MAEYLEALTKGDRWDFRCERAPRCPHCGYVCDLSANDLWNIAEEGEHEIECPSPLCERSFVVWTNVSYSFSTDEQEDQPTLSQHKED